MASAMRCVTASVQNGPQASPVQGLTVITRRLTIHRASVDNGCAQRLRNRKHMGFVCAVLQVGNQSGN